MANARHPKYNPSRRCNSWWGRPFICPRVLRGGSWNNNQDNVRCALKDEEGSVRKVAAEALGGIGPEAKAAVPALIEALKDPEGDVRREAAQTLGQIGPEAKAAVPALSEALKDTEWEVRSGAGRALGGIGPEAKAAIPALIEASKDEYGRDREAADEALWEITEGESGDREDDAGPPGPGESDPGR